MDPGRLIQDSANRKNRYKQDVSVRFVTQELAFEDEQTCCQFICDLGGSELLTRTNEDVRFATAKAGQLFQTAKAELFRVVDIKGQI